MSRKHKKKQDFFPRRNNKGIKKENAPMDFSKLKIRAGMAAVSALLFFSPVVISAAGCIANPAAQENTGISNSEQADSPLPISADDSSTGSTAADTGSTLAADPQNTDTSPAHSDKEGNESTESATRQSGAKDAVETDSDKGSRKEDEEVPETSGSSKTSEMTVDESSPDSHSASAKEDPDEGQDENADRDDAVDDESEDLDDSDGEAGSTSAAAQESTEDPAEQESEQETEEDDEKEDEDEKDVVFSNYGSNDFSGAITPEIVRIPADEWEAYGESLTSFLEREKDFFSAGTPIFFDLKGSEHSASILDDHFKTEKTEDGTAVVIEAAALKDGTGEYENVLEYIFRNAGSTTDGEKVDLILTLDEARIELPEHTGKEDSEEEAPGKIAVSSVSDDHIFRTEARSIPSNSKENDVDGDNETAAAAVDVKVSEKWSARIIWHEGDDVDDPRALLVISDLDEVFGDPVSETSDRERVAMLSGFPGKAFCSEDATVSVSASGYLEGNGQEDVVILPVNSANIQFAWGGTNCSTDLFVGFDRIGSDETSEKERTDKNDRADSAKTTGTNENADSEADSDTNTKAGTTAEEAVPAEVEESAEESITGSIASRASRASIQISCIQEPEKTAALSAGDTVELSMKVKNSGSETLSDVEVSEVLDDDAELTVAWNKSSDSDTGNNILSEGETVPVTVTYTVTQDDLDTGKLVRKTEANAETASRDTVEDEQTSEVILRGTASLDFSKKASVQQVSDARAGASIHYFFTVTNSGSVTLRNIEVIDRMEGLSRIEYDWDESTDSKTGEGYLSPGERVTASATYEITSDDIRNGRIVNKAFARGETLQGNVIESSQPEAPTSISQKGKSEYPSDSPATGDETDILMFLMPFVISITVIVSSYVLEKIQRKKMTFDDEKKD